MWTKSEIRGRAKLGNEAEEIQKLASSQSFLRLADSLLVSLDRDTLSEFLAAYLYFKSKGETNLDFALFVATRKFGKAVTISMNVIAALIPGLLNDKAFRSVVFAAGLGFIRNRQPHSKSEESKDE